MNLNGGILTNAGIYFALCETEDCVDDEVVICTGRSDGTRIVLRSITQPEEFVAIKELSGIWKEIADTVALTADGDLYLLREDGAEHEVIPGTNLSRTDSAGLGRMTSLKQLGQELYVLGYGGQVYRRHPSTNWQPMHVDGEMKALGVNTCLYDVVIGPEDCPYFGGIDLSKFVRTKELVAADEADDVDLWIKLLRARPNNDRMSLRYYNGTWHDVGLDQQGAITVILETGESNWILFSNYGIAWRTEDFESFEEIIALGDGMRFWDIKCIGDRNFILIGQQLNELIDDNLVPFSPPLPLQNDGYVNIAGSDGVIAAFHELGVVELREGKWQEIFVTF